MPRRYVNPLRLQLAFNNHDLLAGTYGASVLAVSQERCTVLSAAFTLTGDPYGGNVIGHHSYFFVLSSKPCIVIASSSSASPPSSSNHSDSILSSLLMIPYSLARLR